MRGPWSICISRRTGPEAWQAEGLQTGRDVLAWSEQFSLVLFALCPRQGWEQLQRHCQTSQSSCEKQPCARKRRATHSLCQLVSPQLDQSRFSEEAGFNNGFLRQWRPQYPKFWLGPSSSTQLEKRIAVARRNQVQRNARQRQCQWWLHLCLVLQPNRCPRDQDWVLPKNDLMLLFPRWYILIYIIKLTTKNYH